MLSISVPGKFNNNSKNYDLINIRLILMAEIRLLLIGCHTWARASMSPPDDNKDYKRKNKQDEDDPGQRVN